MKNPFRKKHKYALIEMKNGIVKSCPILDETEQRYLVKALIGYPTWNWTEQRWLDKSSSIILEVIER